MPRFVFVQREPALDVTDRVSADGRLAVLELLLHSLHYGLAVQALEVAMHELWVEGASLPLG